MGFKQIDIVPIASYGPTAVSPPGKTEQIKVFQVARTDTVASVKAIVPADASILSVYLYGSVASNAATTATVTFNIIDNSGTISTGSYDVKTSGAVSGGVVNQTNLPNLEAVPLVGDKQIQAVYAETGTASTLGGPWKVAVRYVR